MISWLVMDLGNVMLEVDPSNIYNELAILTGHSSEVVRERLRRSTRFWSAFGVEEVSPEQVSAEVNQALEYELSLEQVIHCLNSELGPEISVSAQKVAALRGRVQTACLSNTNSIHWARLLSGYPCMQHFDRRFASQELGIAKPNRKIYDHAACELAADPRTLLFFDDRLENVLAARDAGWQARLFTSPEQLLVDLAEYGL